MKIYFGVILSMLMMASSFGQQKKICITIDDMPLVTHGITDTTFQNSLMHKIVSSLTQNNIPAIGFVNETKLYRENQRVPFQIGLLKYWVASGLQLGNHTFSHPDYNGLSLKKYGEDILKGEVVTNEILAQRNGALRYFRHPFLHTGNTKEKSDSLSLFLSNHGYTVAPVTVDNEDYVFALAYKRARDKRDSALMMQIGKDYVLYMEKKVRYFEKQARALFGRDINQILLLHANALNGDYLNALAAMFRENNYTFISLEKALEDEAYKTAVTVYGRWGISWLDRWALSQGRKGDFFKDDPVTPEYVTKLAE